MVQKVIFSEQELEKFLEQPKNVLQIFMSEFCERNGYDHNKVKATLGNNCATQTMWKNKSWSKSHTNRAMVGLDSDDFQVLFCEGTTDSIELYMIEVKNQNKGIGTRVLNEMLDLADDFGIKISCVPTPYKNLDDAKYCSFLRQWYTSFGFKSSRLSPTMTYYPE